MIIDNLTDFALNEESKRLHGGRPETDVIVMFKMLVLQQ